MDTRIRGYDSHIVMPDLIGHPSLICHARLDRASMVLKTWIPAFAGMTVEGRV
jgi:hypothetical protein